MKAWRFDGKGGSLALEDVPKPQPRPGGVVVKMEAAPVLSYMRQVLDGTLGYALPSGPFIPGTNGIGVLDAVGEGVYHLEPGERVALNPHHLANERVRDPAQILIGLTAIGSARFAGLDAATKVLQADWRDGVFAEYAHLPAAAVTPLDGLGDLPAERLAALAKFIVPYGGFLRGGLAAGETVIVNGATGGVGSIAIASLARLGYHVVALTGKPSESEWLLKLGAREVKLRSELDLTKIKPLDRAMWSGAIDNLGGEVLAWMASMALPCFCCQTVCSLPGLRYGRKVWQRMEC